MSRTNRESGYTLIETMISMLVLALVLTFVYQVLISVQKSTYNANQRLENLEEGRVLMATVTKDIRTAARPTVDTAPFTLAKPKEVIFYANLNTSTIPVRVRIVVESSGLLREEVVKPTGTPEAPLYNGTPEVRVVGRYITNDDVFTYWAPDGPDADEDQDLVTNGTAALTAAQVLKVEAVEVHLQIRKSTNAFIEPTSLINRVRLPNVFYKPLGEG